MFWVLSSSVDHVVKNGELTVEVKISIRTISEATAHSIIRNHYHCWTEKDVQEVLSHYAAAPAQLWLSCKYLQRKTSAVSSLQISTSSLMHREEGIQ